MTALRWTDCLAAPRSLATRHDLAVVAIEDPGVLELRLSAGDAASLHNYGSVLGINLPLQPWRAVWVDAVRVVWVGPDKWRIFAPRARIASLRARLSGVEGPGVMSDLTGAFACFRIAGSASDELMLRVCPLDLGQIDRDQARGTSIAGTGVLVIREVGAVKTWLVLAPRSYARHVAAALVEAARTPGRLGLFESAPPPPV